MRIVSIFLLGVLVTVTRASADNDSNLVRKTLSPNGRVAIVHTGGEFENSRYVPDSYYFVDVNSDKRLGEVMPLSLKDVRNVDFRTSWSRDSSKVAVLIYYGNNASTVILYTESQGKIDVIGRLGEEAADDDREKFEMFKMPISSDALTKFGISKRATQLPFNEIGCWDQNNILHLLGGLYVNDVSDLGTGKERLFMVEYTVRLRDKNIFLVKASEIREPTDDELKIIERTGRYIH